MRVGSDDMNEPVATRLGTGADISMASFVCRTLTIAFAEKKTRGLTETNGSKRRQDGGSAMPEESLRLVNVVHPLAASPHML